MENSTRNNKYGEIVLETENTFRIICDLCSDTFLTLENFRYHILKHLQNNDSEDSTDSFLDFIFKDNIDAEKVTNLEIEVNPIQREKINIKDNSGNSSPDIDDNESIENLLTTIDHDTESENNLTNYNSSNFSDDLKNMQSNINEMENNKTDEKIEYCNNSDSDDDSIKVFDNLEQKKQYDFNVIKAKLKNIFALFKDYCPICLHTFSSLSALKRHTKIHLKDYSKEQIIEYYKNCVKQNEQNNTNQNNINITPTTSWEWDTAENIQQFKCSYCDKIFVHNNDLKRHTRSHIPNNISKRTFISPQCKICNLTFNTNYKYSCHMLEKHNIEKPFECNICPQTFKKYSFLARHIRFHNDDKRYECEYCGKRFMENNQRKLHIRAHHTHEKLCQCDECGRTFVSLTAFRMHKMRHANNKQYKCTKCDMKFYTPYYLKNHSVKHSKEKPYKCDVCNAKFGMRGALWTHRRLHSNERKYKCKICEKTFVQSAGLHSHMKTHYNKEKLLIN